MQPQTKLFYLFNELFRNDYFLWLRENSSVTKGNNGWFELTTPYLSTHNKYKQSDYITVYVKQEKGVITIADDGGLLMWIEAKGVEKILNTYGVKVLNGELSKKSEVLNGELCNKSDAELLVMAGELYVECNEGDFVQKLHNLISAMIELNALRYATTN
jgi:hypothetical protein